LWFDSNELDRLKSHLDESIRWMDVDLWKYANRADFKPSLFDCPQCQTVMSEFQFDDSNVKLEFCINCGGAWLDRGELDIILKFLQERVAAKTLLDIGKSSVEQFTQIFSGPKGMIEEVRDFVAAWRMLSLKFSITHPKLSEKYQAIRQSLPF
jgi:Zn-finger nucleic acid-binding protein